ncbi:hypothetical protein [Carboxylicivirga sp. N1Y90]|uniref:hypothetical protein n=1 Tax=Carboxylicivirga fragile TaxID=3417571 RepID=UPI003D33A39F|nr:hypothetical protein [Marinilabiliaceae bacterium N1Y90]
MKKVKSLFLLMLFVTAVSQTTIAECYTVRMCDGEDGGRRYGLICGDTYDEIRESVDEMWEILEC